MNSDEGDRAVSDQVQIALTKSWQVECEDCGIVDVRPTREDAAESAIDHAQRRHNSPVNIVRSWKLLAPYKR